MAGETLSLAEASASDVQSRQRSTIAFPYEDLNSALEMVEAIHGNAGLGDCDDDQLAAWSGQSAKSSGFRVQLSSARLFGFITTEGGRHKLTDLGAAAMDPNEVRSAKVQAFMNVPLFKAIFDKYRGGVLPGQASALEREIVGLGVSDKVKDRARVKFEKSAEQAGFFEHGKNRLVTPAVVQQQDRPAQKEQKKEGGDGNGAPSGGGGNMLPPDVDPIIKGLLARLPKSGEVWPEAQRDLWLELLKGSFKLIYKDSE